MQVGLDFVISANCKSQLQFQPTNIYQLLYLTLSTYFQSAAVIGERNANSPTTQVFFVGCKLKNHQTIMKILTVTLLLILSNNLFAQNKIIGRYRDYFGSRIQLNTDNTFKYTWHFDMVGSWTKGTWTLTGDTVYFRMTPTYDTLSQTNSIGIISDTLILSTDEIPEHFTQSEFASLLLSSHGQNRTSYPDKLLFRKGRLYKIQNGKLVIRKQKGFGTGKKWIPWFFKSED
jgi:hypothetical protein